MPDWHEIIGFSCRYCANEAMRRLFLRWFGNNSKGQLVGGNWDSKFNWSHAFIWQDDVMTDLNKLFPDRSNLYATFAAKSNEQTNWRHGNRTQRAG